MATKPEQEPSIEEILASIRQIISDDEQPREPEAVVEPEPAPPPPPPPPPPVEEPKFADVLELTNEIREEPKFTIPVEPPKVIPAPKPVEMDFSDSEEGIFSESAAEATASAFSRLVGNFPVEREENKTIYADGRVTLEDIVKDMLRPMLRDWVNTHVPKMVERLVEKELEKLARQARDD